MWKRKWRKQIIKRKEQRLKVMLPHLMERTMLVGAKEKRLLTCKEGELDQSLVQQHLYSHH